MITIYCPITLYHLILSFIMQAHNNKQKNCIVLDSNIFNKEIIDKIIETNAWHEIYIINKKSNIRLYWYKVFPSVNELRKLYKINGAKFIFFSPGDYCITNLINSVSINNYVVMCEDGVAPYYFEKINDDWLLALGNSAINKFKKKLLYWLSPKLKFKASNIKDFVVFKKDWLNKDVLSKNNIKTYQIELNCIEKAFDVLNIVFDHKQINTCPTIGVVYFDSYSYQDIQSEKDFKFLSQLFLKFKNQKILIRTKLFDANRLKLFNKIKEKYDIDIIYEKKSMSIPWELFCYNNQSSLRGSIFISKYLTTAMVSPNILMGWENDSYIMCDLLSLTDSTYKNQFLIKSLADRINRTYKSKKIHFPQNIIDMDIS
jgi:hypothetical protein